MEAAHNLRHWKRFEASIAIVFNHAEHSLDHTLVYLWAPSENPREPQMEACARCVALIMLEQVLAWFGHRLLLDLTHRKLLRLLLLLTTTGQIDDAFL